MVVLWETNLVSSLQLHRSSAGQLQLCRVRIRVCRPLQPTRPSCAEGLSDGYRNPGVFERWHRLPPVQAPNSAEPLRDLRHDRSLGVSSFVLWGPGRLSVSWSVARIWNNSIILFYSVFIWMFSSFFRNGQIRYPIIAKKNRKTVHKLLLHTKIANGVVTDLHTWQTWILWLAKN